MENFEDALDLGLQYTADWLGVDEGGTVSLFKDFAAATLTDASAQLVVNMAQAGQITKEMQRRGVLSPDLDAATEVGKAKDDEPPLGTAGVE